MSIMRASYLLKITFVCYNLRFQKPNSDVPRWLIEDQEFSCKFYESENHTVIWVGRTLVSIHQVRSLKAPFNPALNISRDEVYITSLRTPKFNLVKVKKITYFLKLCCSTVSFFYCLACCQNEFCASVPNFVSWDEDYGWGQICLGKTSVCMTTPNSVWARK